MESEINLFSTEAIKQLVRENLGIAYLPRFIVEQELKNEIVREIPTGIQNKMIETVYTPHKNKWITPAMNLFIQILRKDQKENCRFKY